jgi:hypothetical protein
VAGVPYLILTRGYPRFQRSIRRRLRQGSDRMAQAYGTRSGRLHTDTSPAAVAALRAEITDAWLDRNLQAGRDADLAAWHELYDRAREVTTLRVGGKLAAWVIARPRPASLEVLAGQLVPGYEDLFPGRAVEAHLIARAMTDTRPLRWWQREPEFRYATIRWGDGSHAGSLIAVS